MRLRVQTLACAAVFTASVAAGLITLTAAPALARDCQSVDDASAAGGNVSAMPHDSGATGTQCYDTKPSPASTPLPAASTLPKPTLPTVKPPTVPSVKPPKVPAVSRPVTPQVAIHDDVPASGTPSVPKVKTPKRKKTAPPPVVDTLDPSQPASEPQTQPCAQSVVESVPWWAWLLAAAGICGLGYTLWAGYTRAQHDEQDSMSATDEDSDQPDEDTVTL